MGTPADAADGPAGQVPPLRLPEPTGPSPVGTTSLWLADGSRPDPWAARAATPARHERNLPLVVLSPGYTGSRSTLTALAEDLASHGYVAAGIDHTYESHATAFPDGRVTTCLSREARQSGGGFWEKVAAGRAADASFVISELTGTHPAWPGAGLIDPSKVAMAGHSAGGAAAIAALLADARIRAGIDLDGSTVAEIPDRGLSRPFMFLGKASNYTPASGAAVPPGTREWKQLRGAVSTWEPDWRLMRGWKRWLVVASRLRAFPRSRSVPRRTQEPPRDKA